MGLLTIFYPETKREGPLVGTEATYDRHRKLVTAKPAIEDPSKLINRVVVLVDRGNIVMAGMIIRVELSENKGGLALSLRIGEEYLP